MSVARAFPALAQPRIDRQVVVVDGTTRNIVKIPDYQVKLKPEAPWHRRGAIESETACGVATSDGTQALRSYVLDDDLCTDGCFSPHELRLGVAAVESADDARFDLSDG